MFNNNLKPKYCLKMIFQIKAILNRFTLSQNVRVKFMQRFKAYNFFIFCMNEPHT